MWICGRVGVGCVGVDVGLGVSGAISRLARHNVVVSLLPLILHTHTHTSLFFNMLWSVTHDNNFSDVLTD